MKRVFSEREWVIGLYCFSPIRKQGLLFSRFNKFVNEKLVQFGLNVTHVGIEGEGYVGKAQKVTGEAYRRLIDSGFKGISILNLMSNPTESSQPAYDRIVSASLSITPCSDNLLVFSMNDGIVKFGSDEFIDILRQLENIHDWDSGYALVDLVSRQPEFHVMGLDDGNLTPDELDKLTKWYCAQPNDKTSRIRSIYPYNLLNEVQLSQKMNNGLSLQEFASNHHGSILTKEGFHKLTLWAVPVEDIQELRDTIDDEYVAIS